MVVDECFSCGTYFDAGELAGVVEFIRGGGLTWAEQRDAQEAQRDLAHRKRMSEAPPRSMGESKAMALSRSSASLELELELVIGFLRWVGRWIRRLRR